MATEALKIEHIDAFYGDSHVLHGVSLSLKEGQVLALLGRNGAGKTTCISSIMGLVAPRNGTSRCSAKPSAACHRRPSRVPVSVWCRRVAASFRH